MKISRTYPQPDSPAPHLGARERALNTFKYLLDLEPEQAIHHPRFAVMVHAFEQSERTGWNGAYDHLEENRRPHETRICELLVRKQLDKSYCDQLSSSFDAEIKPLQPNEPFTPDGI